MAANDEGPGGLVGDQGAEGDSFDRIAVDLQQLRMEAGAVSYAEIVRRIARRRAAEGQAPEACRPARTTVYDAFGTGRTRLNAELVGEIVAALGESPASADQWVRRCLDARRRTERSTSVPTEVVSTATDAEIPGAEPSHDEVQAPAGRPSGTKVVALLAVCLGVNLLGQLLVRGLGLPLYLDMLGTAVVAMALSPRLGVTIGLATNLAGAAFWGPAYIPFGLVNAVGALVWGWGIHRWGMDRSLSRFFLLNIVAAVACSVVAVPILITLFGGGTGHASDSLTRNLESLGVPVVLAVLEANLFHSVADKLVCGFVALAVLGSVRRAVGATGEGKGGPDAFALRGGELMGDAFANRATST